jgi:hypothetical protein
MFFKLGLTTVTYYVEMYGKMRQPVFIRFLSSYRKSILFYVDFLVFHFRLNDKILLTSTFCDVVDILYKKK